MIETKIANIGCYTAHQIIKEISEINNKIAPTGCISWFDVICSH